MKCRHCHSECVTRFVDLGAAPPSNSYLSRDGLDGPEKSYPLVVMVCEQCWLVQTRDFAQADELFSHDYAYFSSFSSSWLRHAETYAERMSRQRGLGPASLVVEVASNDGYLLQHFQRLGIRSIGIEPTASTAAAAREKGIETIEEFFGVALAQRLVQRGLRADLMAANNVLAHVPDINDFASGFAVALKPEGLATFEFPHLLRLVAENQFDTIYHEHFSYLSLSAVDRIFAANGLTVVDVEELGTHGGSLRVHARRSDAPDLVRMPAVEAMLGVESRAGITSRAYYEGFQAHAERVKDDFLLFLINAKRSGQRVCAYGAAAKGNTLLNFAGCRPDLLSFVVDRNPAKQGKYMPGSRIPIVDEQQLWNEKPDLIVILPWNLRDEVKAQLSEARKWGGRFVTAVPALKVD